MFTHLYGGMKTFFTYLESGTMQHSNRKIPNTHDSLQLAAQCCHLPAREEWSRMYCVLDLEQTPCRLKAAASMAKRLVRTKSTVQKRQKRVRYADQRLARVAQDTPGVQQRTPVAEARSSGPPRPQGTSTHIASPKVDALTMDMLSKLRKGRQLKGWSAFHVKRALQRASAKAKTDDILRLKASRGPSDVSAEGSGPRGHRHHPPS